MPIDPSSFESARIRTEAAIARGREKRGINLSATDKNHIPDAGKMVEKPILQQHENQNHPAGLRSALREPIKRTALDASPEGEKPRKRRPERCYLHRYRITYTVYAVRPMDFDNIAIKKIQDELVHQNFLPDDNWKVLDGSVISRKAETKILERTEIEIEEIP